jgi:hypothetical protein
LEDKRVTDSSHFLAQEEIEKDTFRENDIG